MSLLAKEAERINAVSLVALAHGLEELPEALSKQSFRLRALVILDTRTKVAEKLPRPV